MTKSPLPEVRNKSLGTWKTKQDTWADRKGGKGMRFYKPKRNKKRIL